MQGEELEVAHEEEGKFNETDYINKRKNEFVIEFKKEPPKCST